MSIADSLTVYKNEREKLRNAQLIIKMAGQSTFISNPSDMSSEPRKFEFDYSYWSHDQFVEQDDGYLAPETEKYADQVSEMTVYVLFTLTKFIVKYECTWKTANRLK